MIRAAVKGVIDFHAARPRDLDWWRRCNVLIEEMGRQDRERLDRDAMHYHLVLASVAATMGGDKVQDTLDSASERFDSILKLVCPWDNRAADKKKTYEELADVYRKTIGDPNDPAFKEILDSEIKKLQRPPAQTMRPEEVIYRHKLAYEERLRQKQNQRRR